MAKNQDFNILVLNDDCLAEIFEYLDSIDLLKLYRIHSRFHEAIGKVLRKKCVNIKPYSEDFLEKFGDKIKIVKIVNYRAVTELIKKYISGGNVEKCELYCSGMLLDEELIQENLKFFQSLKSLIFKSHRRTFRWYSDFLEFIRAGKNLTKINLHISTFVERIDYEQLYNKVSEIRKNQESQYVLIVTVKDLLVSQSICFKTGKWVKMILANPLCE